MLNLALFRNTYSYMLCDNLKLVQVWFFAIFVVVQNFLHHHNHTMDERGVGGVLQGRHLFIFLQVFKVVLGMATGCICPL